MADPKSQRSQPRLDERDTIFIQTLDAADHPSEQDAIVICNSVEISATGLRVRIDDAIETGTILRLGVELQELEQPLYLVGEVRWCEPNTKGGGGYNAGFKLLESDGTDYEIWRSLLEQMIASDSD